MSQDSDLKMDTAVSDWNFIDSMDARIFGSPCHIKLQPGFEIVVLDFVSGPASKQVFLLDASPIELSFHLKGHGAGEICYGLHRKEKVEIGPDMAVLSYCPGTKCTTCIPANEVVRVLHIYMTVETMAVLFPLESDILPHQICSLLQCPDAESRDNSEPFYLCSPVSPRTCMALQQLFSCPFQGAIRRLYLEAKAMELVALQMETMIDSPSRKSSPLKKHDVERIYAARNILLQNMDNLPGLAELARKVGLNQTKLKKGFRQVFNTTVLGCVNDYRLEQSRKILARGDATVSEVAYQLGFYDPTHFIRHFKARFGVTPGAWVKNRRSF